MKQPLSGYTPYQARVFDAVAYLKGQGWKAATVHDIAVTMGSKPTPSLRRRLRELVAAGSLREYRFTTDNGGLGKAYWFALDTSLDTQNVPF